MTGSHYSLRWNNHQTHILAAFEALLHAERLVDVTLVCADTSVKAHKVVLSACSPMFQRIFSETPCKHPVIVLKDFSAWEVQSIIDFMYKGEISVAHEQLTDLIKVAESLEVRGLANPNPSDVEKESTSNTNRTPTPSTSPNDYERNFFNCGRNSNYGTSNRGRRDRRSPFSPIPVQNNYETPPKLPHMSRLSFPETLLPRQESQSPLPRRKQARPRRRSGESCGAQDLTIGVTKSSSPCEETAENLCIKKQVKEDKKEIKQEKPITPEPDVESSEMDFNMHSVKEYGSSPINMNPPLTLKQEVDNPSPLPYPAMPSISALSMTSSHSKFFGLDSPLGLFPPGLDGCRNTLFDMPNPRTTPDSDMFVKKKMGRPKGQHSAPRGGPPRSWTNAELTEALQHVWNKKMTTSQASRIFGIPYNSLLMYVRGKYGKSLKLEQLRKDCIGGPTPSMDILNMTGGTNNNNACKTEREVDQIQPNTRPPSTEEQPHPQPPIFNPFAHSFYPDFGTGFPIPVSMIHLLPQSEKSREHHSQQQQQPMEEDCKQRTKEMDEEQDVFRPPSLSIEDRRELVQQNGQN